MSLKFHRVAPENIVYIWPLFRLHKDEFENHCRDEMNMHSLYESLVNDEREMFIITENENVIQCYIILECVHYDRISALRVVFITGSKMSKWLPFLIEKLDEYAEINHLSRIEAVGRKGWERMLKKYNYNYAYTHLIKDL